MTSELFRLLKPYLDKNTIKLINILLKKENIINSFSSDNYEYIVYLLDQIHIHLSSTEKHDLFFKAIELNNLEIVKLLFEKYDLNKENYDIENALSILASFEECTPLAQYLIENNSEEKDKLHGIINTALSMACQCNNSDLISLLLDYGADINSKNSNQWTPLHIACQYSNLNIVKHLLKNNANVNEVDQNLNTPLYLVCQNGNTEIVNLLLKKRADVNSQNSLNWTPLHIACYNGKINVVETLLNNKAKINLKTNEGKTPLHLACQNNDKKLVSLLLLHKADDNIKDKNLNTALHIAVKNNNYTIASLLLICKMENKNELKQLLKYIIA